MVIIDHFYCRIEANDLMIAVYVGLMALPDNLLNAPNGELDTGSRTAFAKHSRRPRVLADQQSCYLGYCCINYRLHTTDFFGLLLRVCCLRHSLDDRRAAQKFRTFTTKGELAENESIYN